MQGGLETESLNALERGKERKEASPKVAGDLTAHRASHSLRKACCCEGSCKYRKGGCKYRKGLRSILRQD